MPTPKPNSSILVVEDDPALGASLLAVLGDEGYDAQLHDDGAAGCEAALSSDYQLVITDYRLPGMGGMELVERVRAAKPALPVVMMTSHGTADLAIGATREGAFDYLLKPFDMDDFLRVVERGLAAGRARSGKVALGVPPGESASTSGIIGSGPAMNAVFKEIGRAAPTGAGVLVTGETGTGKELVARAIFQHSKRADEPFVAVNCGAIPENLLESELFGHRRGAFTGAVSDRPGRFEQAHGGTLFLDEIGEMPMSVQVKLLRVLQEKTVQPLGATSDLPVDVRVIAATNRDLEARVAEGEFRQDLLFRLNAVVIPLPPLRERREDIAALVSHFSAAASREFGVAAPGWSKGAMNLLENAPWPGNVRQLENGVRRAVLAASGGDATTEMLEGIIGGGAPTGDVGPADDGLAALARAVLEEAASGGSGAHAMFIEEAERELFAQALDRAGGNQSRAAGWLGISRVTLRAKLRRYGIDAKESGGAG